MSRWTRKLTFPDDLSAVEDWTVLRDGLVVGRVFADKSQGSRAQKWRWAVLTIPAANGWAETMGSALERVRGLAAERWGHEPHGWP